MFEASFFFMTILLGLFCDFSRMMIHYQYMTHPLRLSCSSLAAKVPDRPPRVCRGRRAAGPERHPAVHPKNQTQPVQGEMVQARAGAGRAGEHHPHIQRTRLQALRPPGAAGLPAEGSRHGRLAAARPAGAGGRRHVPLRAGLRRGGRERGHFLVD